MQAARKRTSVPVSARTSEPIEICVGTFVRQCQAVAARLTDLEGDSRFDALMEALHQAPVDCRTRDGRAVIAALVVELAARVLRETERDRAAAPPAANLQASDLTCLTWTRAGGNPHVTLALDVLRRRSTEPAMCLASLAASVGVSRWHLSRLLRHWTGHGFFGLLAKLRV
jgi:AraC-like DNA-binding protein